MALSTLMTSERLPIFRTKYLILSAYSYTEIELKIQSVILSRFGVLSPKPIYAFKNIGVFAALCIGNITFLRRQIQLWGCLGASASNTVSCRDPSFEKTDSGSHTPDFLLWRQPSPELPLSSYGALKPWLFYELNLSSETWIFNRFPSVWDTLSY